MILIILILLLIHKRMNIIELNGIFVNNFILYNHKEIILIDTGFLNGISFIKNALLNIHKKLEDIDYILLTHGHLDHVVHLKKLKEISGATIICSKEEQIHIDGKYSYKGINLVCDGLEKFGRFYFNYKAIKIDHHVKDGDILNILGGIKVIHLPGHSIGHLGYLFLESKYLFIGDLVNTRRKKHRFPPAIFNSFPHLIPESIHKVYHMNLNGIISNHGPRLSPEEQWNRFRIFAKDYLKQKIT